MLWISLNKQQSFFDHFLQDHIKSLCYRGRGIHDMDVGVKIQIFVGSIT